MLKTLVATALLAASTAVFAQSAPAPADKPSGKRPHHHMRHDCSKAADPKACEERRAKAREAMKKAHAACDAKAGQERRDCMRKEMCAQAKDPAQCEAKAKQRAERHKQRHEQKQPSQDQKK